MADRRKTEKKQNMISLPALCDRLSISAATGKNWLRSGRLAADGAAEDGAPLFYRATVERLVRDMASGENPSLKRRRNKNFVSGRRRYRRYIPEDTGSGTALGELLAAVDAADEVLGEETRGKELFLRLILGEYALRLMVQALGRGAGEPSVVLSSPGLGEKDSYLKAFFDGKLELGPRGRLVTDLICDSREARSLLARCPGVFSVSLHWREGEDFLGVLYLSLKSMGERKAFGAYYTPNWMVDRLIAMSCVEEEGREARILDPSCGTGNFLLRLPPGVRPEQIYGMDLDGLSVSLTRLNLAMRYPSDGVDWLYRQIRRGDFLEEEQGSFRVILGNPPWGARYSEAEKTRLAGKFISAGTNPESFDVFLEESLRRLEAGGRLAFVLPEAVLHVRSHCAIRRLLRERGNIPEIVYLGDAFHGVQCPAVLLLFRHTGREMTAVGTRVSTRENSFVLGEERRMSEERFSFLMTDEEYRVAGKLKNGGGMTTLQGQADFALGIVTGDNRHFLKSGPEPGTERVLLGTDVRKYRLEEGRAWLAFTPERFQQVAAESLYRAEEKLIYRFVSGKLMFAYDNGGRLTLNSANIVIPRISGLDMKFVLAVLNSRMAQFLYEKDFHSIKVLRSHIEGIPIPRGPEAQAAQVVRRVEALMMAETPEGRERHYEEIDAILAEMYGLSKEEYGVIRRAVGSPAKFL